MKPSIVEGRRHGVRILRNPHYQPAAEDSAQAPCFTGAEAEAALARISTWPLYRPTPLWRLEGAARRLGVAQLYCKDEGARLGLQSFKALGALFASVATVADLLSQRTGGPVTDTALLSGRHAGQLEGTVLTSATDGNHGFSLAHAARRMGCRARIYIPRGVSRARAEALGREGAEVIRVNGIYEEAMDAAVRAAADEPDTHLISDYATADYRAVPILCMLGYSVIVQEIARQIGGPPPTHVFAPAGCGGLAASIITASGHAWREEAPRVVVVEPNAAACVFASFRAGSAVRIDGDLDTIMGGLACAAVSAVAWPVLAKGAFACLAMDDSAAVEAMRLLARPYPGDPAIVSGETGAAGMAAVMAVAAEDALRSALGLDADSRVLVISCESATDPDHYLQILDDGGAVDRKAK